MSRRAFDYYPTPPEYTRALLERLTWPAMLVAEPCAADGQIERVLRDHGHRVVTADIVEKWDTDHPGLDFMSRTADVVFANVGAFITNPPYCLAPEFVRKALTITPRVAMFLRMTFLEACANRSDLLPQLARVYICPRADFKGDGNTDSVPCAWFIWEPGHDGPAVIDWISKTELERHRGQIGLFDAPNEKMPSFAPAREYMQQQVERAFLGEHREPAGVIPTSNRHDFEALHLGEPPSTGDE